MSKKVFLICMMAVWLAPFVCNATGIDKNTAKMQAMDKITGRVSVIYVPVGGAVDFGSLSIAVRSCKTRPAEETPDNFVFADVADRTLQGENINIFRGWMISSSPATNAVEHPIYDVWLLQCVDKKVDKSLLLSETQFAAREDFPMVRNADSALQTLKTDEQTQPTLPMEEMNEEERQPQPLLPSIEFSYDEADELEEKSEETQQSADDETSEPDINAAAESNAGTNEELRETISILPPDAVATDVE